MKKEDNFSSEKKEEVVEIEALSAAELQMIQKRQDQLEDSSAIPPPTKKKPNKLITLAKKNRAITIILSVFAVALIATLVLLSIYVAEIMSANSRRDYVFTLGKEEVKVKYEDTVINDVLYIDMNMLAKYAELTVSGSEESMKYISVGENYMKFTDESDYAIINATKIIMPAPAIVGDGKCLVPYQVVTKAVTDGLSFTSNLKKHKIEIIRETYKEEGVEYKVDITFSPERFEIAGAIPSIEGVVFDYKNDVSELMEYIDPKDNTPYLMLVNPESPLSPEYVPENLEQIAPQYTAIGDKYFLDGCAERALDAMMAEMYDTLNMGAPYVTSAYRSYRYQQTVFNSYVSEYLKKGYTRDEAIAETLRTSAAPGTSEHQSGLCVDFYTTSMTNGLNNEEFEKTSAFLWLSANAHKYGFILRYPEDKSEITSYDYESWHYRFVGRRAATEMYLSGLCLEEYLEFI